MTTDYIYTNLPKSAQKPLVKNGHFTTAFIYDSEVLLISRDPIKECMAWGWFPDSIHVPQIEFMDELVTKEVSKADYRYCGYRMPKYSRPTSLKASLIPEDWKLYKELRKISCFSCPIVYDRHNHFIGLVDSLDIAADIKETLVGMYEACMNYSHNIMFEISPRNVAVENGRLILLDCFFDKDRLDFGSKRKIFN